MTIGVSTCAGGKKIEGHLLVKLTDLTLLRPLFLSLDKLDELYGSFDRM